MSLQSRVYGFIPTSITGCALWLDGADPAGNGVVPSAGNLSTWTDKSGKSNSPTSSSGTYPTYSPTSKCVTWTGGASQLTFPNSLHQYVVGTAFTVFFVEQRTTGSENFIIRGSSQGTNLNLLIGHSGTSPTTSWRFAFYGNDLDYTGLPSYSSNEPATVSCFMYSKPNRAIYHNGSVSANASDNNSSDLTSWTGAMIGGNSIWPGYTGNVFEMLIYSTSLTLIQRQQVESYLAQKWGLKSSLPVTHPGLGETIYRSDFTKQNIMTARPFYTAFSPTQISGCVLWLDAADPAGTGVLPASGTLTTWTDKSTAGNNATGGVSPTYSSTTKAVSFNGSSTYLQTSLSAVPSNETFFAIFTSTIPISNANRFNCIIGASGNNGRDINVLTSFAGNSSAYDLRYDSWAVGSISLTGYGGITFNTLTLATTQFTGGQGAGSTYGSNFGSFQSLSFSSSSTTRIGAGNGGDYFTGTINEIIMYNTVLGLSDRQKLESYLAQKWGLTASLPGGHLNATQPAGAITLTALTNFRILSRSRGSPITSTTLNTIATYLRNYMSEFRNPSFYGYNLDGNSYHINDGGGDMYDAGNWTNPWLIAGTQITGASSSQQAFTINYAATTATTVDTSFIYASLGYAASSGTTITSNHPLTVLGFRDTTGHPVGFQLAGNSGADGSGTLASGILYAGDIIQGFTVHAFYRETYNAGDPSHCNLFILLGHPSWISVFGTISSFADPVANGGNGCFFYTSGAGVSNILAIQTLLSKSGGVLVTAAECQTVVQAFVDRVKLAVGF